MKAKSSKAKTLTSKAMKKTKGGAAAALDRNALKESMSVSAINENMAGGQDAATLAALRTRTGKR